MKTRKMSLYRFVTTFCLFPVTDWGASVAAHHVRGHPRVPVLAAHKRVDQGPMFFIGLIFLLTWMPDTIGWIFLKIGEIGLSVAFLVMNALMPDVFATGSASIAGGPRYGARA